jgi:hypothetical protein
VRKIKACEGDPAVVSKGSLFQTFSLKQNMKQIIFIFLLLASSVITICACSVRPEVNGVDVYHLEDFRHAKAVFTGKVIDVSIDDRPIRGTQRYNILYKIRFSVEKSWKGPASEITVVSDNGQSNCGRFNFQIGQKYLVYADTHEDKLAAWATVGSSSQPFNPEDFQVKRRLKQLNSFWFRRKAN